MKNVKNFLKVIIIIFLVAAAIGGTVYFFFTHLRVKPDSFEDLQNYLSTSEKVNFDDNIALVSARASSKGNSNLQFLIFAGERLDMVANDLVLYYIVNKNYNVDEFAFGDRFSQVETALNNVSAVVDEFNTKDTGANFPADLGADDVLKSYANYLTKYANLLLFLNDNIGAININKNCDVKFSIYNLFLNVCISTFDAGNIEKVGSYVAVKNKDNLKTIIGEQGKERFKVENSIVVFSIGNFSKYNNQFIKYYNAANKNELFTNFASLVTAAQGATRPENSNEANVAECFKILYGV